MSEVWVVVEDSNEGFVDAWGPFVSQEAADAFIPRLEAAWRPLDHGSDLHPGRYSYKVGSPDALVVPTTPPPVWTARGWRAVR